jgi:hypothetical protein
MIYLPFSDWLKGESHEDKRTGGPFFTHHQAAVNKGIEQAENIYLPTYGWLKRESHEDKKDGGPYFLITPTSSKQRN